MGNTLNCWIYNRTKKDAQIIADEMKTIHSGNFLDKFEEQRQIRNNLVDKWIRYLLSPNNLHPSFQSMTYALNFVDARDWRFALSAVVSNWYFRMMRFFGQDRYWRTNSHLEQTLPQWRSDNPVYSDDLFTAKNMSLFFTQYYDPLTFFSRQGRLFLLDTMFLNNFAYKPNMASLGCRAYFTCDFITNSLRLVRVEYEGIVFESSRENTFGQDDRNKWRRALHALYGGASILRTVRQHGVNFHYVSASNMSRFFVEASDPLRLFEEWSEADKNRDPICALLKFSEFKVMNGLGRAVKSLFDHDGFFKEMTPWTDSGYHQFLDHCNTQVMQDIKHDFALCGPGMLYQGALCLNQDESSCQPFFALHRWLEYIRKYMRLYVDAHYGADYQYAEYVMFLSRIRSRFGVRSSAPYREIMIQLLTYVHFLQVRHAMMSSPKLDFLTSRYSYCIRLDANPQLTCHSTIYHHFKHILVDTLTSESWVKMQTPLWAVLPTHQGQCVYKEFQENLPFLENVIPLIHVDQIGISTGL